SLVEGIGFSPDKMLLARAFSYSDAHRYRLGANSDQLPVNRPVVQVNTFSQDGNATQRFADPKLPVHGSNVAGRGSQESADHGDLGLWAAEGDEPFRGAYLQHPEDDDFIQPGILVREVLDDAARDRLAGNIARAMDGVSPEVEERVYEYWTNVDEWLGAEVRKRFTAAKEA